MVVEKLEHGSDWSHQRENQDDQKDQAQAATWLIAPTVATAGVAACIKKKTSPVIRIMPKSDARGFDSRRHHLIGSQWSLAAQYVEL